MNEKPVRTPRRALLGAAATASASGLLAPIIGRAQDNALRVGMVAPISGPLAKFGNETVIGTQFAADLVNESGGAGGRKISIVVADTPTPDLAKSAVEKLVTQDRLKVIIGNYGSSLAIAASTTAVRYGAFYWEQSSASYDITRKAEPHSLKVTWGNFELINRLVGMLQEVIGPKLGRKGNELKVALLHEDSAWGSELAQMMKDAAKAERINLVFIQGYTAAKTSDFTPMILRLKQDPPDVFIAGSYLNDAVKIQQQSKEQELYVKAMIGLSGGHGLTDFAGTLGKAADDIIVIDSNPELNPKSMLPEIDRLNREFIQRFEKKTGKPPASHAVYAFLGSYALFRHVLSRSPSLEPDAILKTAMALDLPFGSLPMGFGLKFTSDKAERPRYNERGLVLMNQWRDGKMVTVWPREFATGEVRGLPLPPWSAR